MFRLSVPTTALLLFATGAAFYLLLTASWPQTQVFASIPKSAVQAEIATASRSAKPTYIKIGSLIDARIQQTEYGQEGWEVSNTAVSFPSTSARPAEAGNIVLYSHNWKLLFGNLSKVKKGETVQITTADQAIHVYTVNSIVDADQNDILWVGPTDREVLTLYTCAGFLDLQRLIIRATPIGK